MAHRVIVDGKEHPLSIVTIQDNELVSIEPFTHEEHSIAFHNGTIRISTSPFSIQFD